MIPPLSQHCEQVKELSGFVGKCGHLELEPLRYGVFMYMGIGYQMVSVSVREHSWFVVVEPLQTASYVSGMYVRTHGA